MLYAFTTQFNNKDIKRFRKTNHLTQAALAQLLGISIKTIEKWEKEDAVIKGTAATLLTILMQNPKLIDQYRIEEHVCNYRLYYMADHLISTVIDVDFPSQKVYFKNYTNDIQKRAFVNKTEVSIQDFEEFLESRCFPRTRDNMKLILKELDLPFYDPLLIIEKTQGRMAEDNFWIKVEKMKYDRD